MSTTIPDLLPSTTHRGEITWTDLFCGGGGSSLGIHHVPGHRVKYALNHWDLAIQAHASNFPDTDHEVTLIEDVHPRRFGRTDCAWFSPSCTQHAYCRGPKDFTDEAIRSRATMWDVARWTSHHKYDVVVVENVVEIKLWCDLHRPVDPKTGKLKGCSCGHSYDAWIKRMEGIGYQAREVYFNSQHALVPQSRDRIYVVFVRNGIKMPDLDFQPPCWCTECSEVVAGIQMFKKPAKSSNRNVERLLQWGRYGKQYVYVCPRCTTPCAPAVMGSWSIVDNNLPILQIKDQKPKICNTCGKSHPVACNTRKRIRVGVKRVGEQVPIQLQVGGNLYERPGYARVWSLQDPLRTITGTPYMAVVLKYGHQVAGRTEVVIPNKTNNVGASTELPAGTITTAPAGHMLVALRSGMNGSSPELPSPAQATRSDQAIVSMRNHGSAETPDLPAAAITAGGRHHGLLMYNGNPGFVRVLEDAAGTITSRDKQSLLVPYNRTGSAHSLDQPSTTIRTHESSALLEMTDSEIDECYFRMLKWRELQKGQAMHVLPNGDPYLLDARVRTSKGTYKDISDQDRVKMIGNAVSSPVATMLAYPIGQALAA